MPLAMGVSPWFFLLSFVVGTSTASNSYVKRQVSELHSSYDFIIAGGGTAGLTVADRLTEAFPKRTWQAVLSPSHLAHLDLHRDCPRRRIWRPCRGTRSQRTSGCTPRSPNLVDSFAAIDGVEQSHCQCDGGEGSWWRLNCQRTIFRQACKARH